ncbi:hypothetical protein [Pseudomonas putida]|uniref:hypothetical protein n=1 Tax=Pseudomonas putida TaxID=303 RepID=UPI000EF6845A|nr:hypothetical protein [Pseudomonas putida]AYN11142.1 hypothetical protein CHN49_15230 [Pseudomonas putida]
MGRLLAHMPVYGPASGGIHALIASSSPMMSKMLSLGLGHFRRCSIRWVLRPRLTLNESLHDRPRHDLDDQKVRQSQAFSHSLDPKQPFTKDF